MMSDPTQDAGPDPLERLRAHRGLLIGFGIVLIVLGAVAAANLIVATVVSIYYVGAMMILGGVAMLVFAFRARGIGRTALLIGGAILHALAGVFVLANPLLASTVLTLMIAIALLAAGVLRVIVALRERPRRAWGRVLAAGVLSALAGLVILFGWPVNSLWIIGMILAIDLIVQGWSWLSLGQALPQG